MPPSFTTTLPTNKNSRKTAILPALLDDSGHLVENDKDKSVILNQFFIQQAAQSAADGIPPPIALPRVTSENEVLHELRVSCEKVRAALRSLNKEKHGLPTRLLIMVANDITPCFHHIFCLSLRCALFPMDRKSVCVSPLYTEGYNRQI